MSLIKCPECKEEISDTVNACPKCGFTLKKKNGKVIIHGYQEQFVANPSVKVYNGDNLITEVGNGQTIELSIEEDTVLTFKCSIRKTEVKVSKDVVTEIMLSFNRGTGKLQAITNIQTDDEHSNNLNQKNYEQAINKQKNNNLIWLIIGISALIVGILIL